MYQHFPKFGYLVHSNSTSIPTDACMGFAWCLLCLLSWFLTRCCGLVGVQRRPLRSGWGMMQMATDYPLAAHQAPSKPLSQLCQQFANITWIEKEKQIRHVEYYELPPFIPKVLLHWHWLRRSHLHQRFCVGKVGTRTFSSRSMVMDAVLAKHFNASVTDASNQLNKDSFSTITSTTCLASKETTPSKKPRLVSQRWLASIQGVFGPCRKMFGSIIAIPAVSFFLRSFPIRNRHPYGTISTVDPLTNRVRNHGGNIGDGGALSVGLFVYMWVASRYRASFASSSTATSHNISHIHANQNESTHSSPGYSSTFMKSDRSRSDSFGDHLLHLGQDYCRRQGCIAMLLVHDDQGSGRLVAFYRDRHGFVEVDGDIGLPKAMLCLL